MGQTTRQRKRTPSVKARRRIARRSKQLPPKSADLFWDLVAIARRLQAPGGCAWDRAQSVSSLLPCLVEETWEVFDSVRGLRRMQVKAELGDVFYTVIFLALAAEREGWFDLRGMLLEIRRKLIRRHPHVFGDAIARTPRDAYAIWQAAKRREKSVPSQSKRLRPLLIKLWDELRRDPANTEIIRNALAGGRSYRRRANKSSNRPNARRKRSIDRSQGRARGL